MTDWTPALNKIKELNERADGFEARMGERRMDEWSEEARAAAAKARQNGGGGGDKKSKFTIDKPRPGSMGYFESKSMSAAEKEKQREQLRKMGKADTWTEEAREAAAKVKKLGTETGKKLKEVGKQANKEYEMRQRVYS